MSIASYFMRNRVMGWLVTLVLLLGGLQAFQGLPRLEDPEFTIKDAMVITRYPGAAPTQVEQEVTYPIENAIQQLPYVDTISSLSSNGLSQITVTMRREYGPDSLPQIWDELRRKVGDVQGQLPPGAHAPWVNDDFGDVFGLMVAVFGDGYDYSHLIDYVDLLRRELILIDGVGKVSVAGQQAEQIFVEISMQKLGSMGIPVARFVELLRTQNIVSNAGAIRYGDRSVRFHPTGEFQDLDDLGDLIVSVPGASQLLRLRDIARIYRGYQEVPSNVYRQDGQQAIALGVSFASGANVINVGDAIRQRLRELEYEQPLGLEAAVFYNQPAQVVASIDEFLLSLAEAVVIVIVVLMLFMGLRTGVLVGLVLLITIIGSFIFMSMKGLDLQRISLGALVVALGMLVDNAIVVVEGILIGMQRGLSKREAADAVVRQTLWPLFGATLIAIIAFAPIGLSKDSTGEIVGSLFWVLLFSLFLSWFTAITVTPFLAELMLPAAADSSQSDDRDPYQGVLFKGFRALLDRALRYRWLTLGLMLVLLVAALNGFSRVKDEFFPPMNTPMFAIDYWLPEGTDIRATLAGTEAVEQALLALPDVTSLTTTVGRGAMRFMLPYRPEKPYSSYTQFLVQTATLEDIPAAMADAYDYFWQQQPDALVNFKRLMVGPQPDGKIEARISGPEPDVLRRLADQVKHLFEGEAAGFAVRDDWRSRTLVLRPRFFEAQARRLGISKQDVDQTLLIGSAGMPIGLYRDSTELLPILLRLPAGEREAVDTLQVSRVWSATNQTYVPLAEVVPGFKLTWEDPLVQRRDRRRTITVMMDPHPLGDATVADLHAAVRERTEDIAMPAGYQLEWGGEYESSNDAQESVFETLPLGFLAMFIITVVLFNSFKKSLVVWCTVPLAIVGVTFGLLLTDMPFSFMALLGVLSLSGMLIKNGIVLMDQIDVERRDGAEPFDAVFMAAVSRARPVTMAALTTILGMIPLLPDLFFQSMAVTIMSGLGFATVLTLVVVPVLYVTLFGIPYRPRSKDVGPAKDDTLPTA